MQTSGPKDISPDTLPNIKQKNTDAVMIDMAVPFEKIKTLNICISTSVHSYTHKVLEIDRSTMYLLLNPQLKLNSNKFRS